MIRHVIYNFNVLFKENKLIIQKTCMKKLSILPLLFLYFLGFGQNFEVSPLKLYFTAEPGESQTKYIKVKNHNNKLETFILKLSDYSLDSKGQGEYLDMGSMKNSVADWLSYSPSFFELQPNEEKEVAITMQQPTDDYGSRWGVIFVSTALEQTSYSADKSVSAGMNISARIIINVYQTPGTNKNYKATISNLSEITQQKDTLRTFTALINNLSDIITECNVYLIATNVETAEETHFNEEKFSMYPKSSRKIELYMNKQLPKGTYSLAAILDYGSRTNLEGTQLIIKVE